MQILNTLFPLPAKPEVHLTNVDHTSGAFYLKDLNPIRRDLEKSTAFATG